MVISVITDDMLNLLKSTTATEYCVLTDLDLRLTVQGAWHPSYLTFYDPSLSQTRIVSIRVSNKTQCPSIDVHHNVSSS